jgi:putative chitinase
MITSKQLVDIMRCPAQRAEKWAGPLDAAMARYDIDAPLRQAAFLAQVGHESGRLIFVREIWNPARCPWQARYEGRTDLGNLQDGDGYRFRGRGLIQITGRANYEACGKALEQDFVAHPELLEEPKLAALSAAWFWDSRKLNALADKGEFRKITLRINGGTNGIEDRTALYEAAKKVLGGSVNGS